MRFVYEEEKQLTHENQHATLEEVLTPETLTALPAEWPATLRKGAEFAELTMLTSVIDRIRERGDTRLADALQRLFDDFEYDEILALIQAKDALEKMN
ncbi:MAG: hypothetical protein GY801_50915 [bacterium]|nr:hypothetical protein [bacterium]